MDAEATILRNPLRSVGGDVGRATDSGAVLAFHRKLPGYQPTPLVAAPRLAASLGLDALLVKDESSRLGLPAFKMLGASWATYRALVDRLGEEPPAWADVSELREPARPVPSVAPPRSRRNSRPIRPLLRRVHRGPGRRDLTMRQNANVTRTGPPPA